MENCLLFSLPFSPIMLWFRKNAQSQSWGIGSCKFGPNWVHIAYLLQQEIFCQNWPILFLSICCIPSCYKRLEKKCSDQIMRYRVVFPQKEISWHILMLFVLTCCTPSCHNVSKNNYSILCYKIFHNVESIWVQIEYLTQMWFF